MNSIEPLQSRRVLVIDDNRSIHEDIRKVFAAAQSSSSQLDAMEMILFDEPPPEPTEQPPLFEVDSAFQGQEGLKLVQAAMAEKRPYSVAFVDVRMPPGWDGIETVHHIWKEDPSLQVVICTAYSDHSWQEITDRLGTSDGLLILKKPFDNIEVNQIAHALSEKWALHRQLQVRLIDLEELVQARTCELQQANAQLLKEIADRQRIEVELRLAQKLEAVGQLAAGVAHEINTPVQYVADSVHFVRNAFSDLTALLNYYRELCQQLIEHTGQSELLEALAQAEEDADLAYIQEQVPKAFERIFDGTGRVSTIVQAMKDFAHPDQREKSFADINKALLSTLTVARNEYKYVADLETELGELPPVLCHISDVNQVFLNIVVNAAHAIADVVGASDKRGKISVRTWTEADSVCISVSDTGGGIPEAIWGRVFDPFFTTKPVGRGTGQGLAIAHTIVVEKHKGTLTFQTEAGKGTTFYIRLPVDTPEGTEAGGA